tara:strand:- start:92 stop:295 length:204 start_codon:yes stop_codon:yes gene_type:complete
MLQAAKKQLRTTSCEANYVHREELRDEQRETRLGEAMSQGGGEVVTKMLQMRRARVWHMSLVVVLLT